VYYPTHLACFAFAIIFCNIKTTDFFFEYTSKDIEPSYSVSWRIPSRFAGTFCSTLVWQFFGSAESLLVLLQYDRSYTNARQREHLKSPMAQNQLKFGEKISTNTL